MKQNIVSGEYNRNGYIIWKNHAIVYGAGNHKQDSSQSAMNEHDRLSLRAIRSMCIRTARNMAHECTGAYAGVEHVAETI